ncbi:hypothetical protein [Mycobacterium uberis]|uniref:hypothetical protein n=1 Tax=Mycobacterium uberis TaxID=2162698 RepID=UPI001FB434F6|nr:hypothetical protein [Mycobacterium uberis]
MRTLIDLAALAVAGLICLQLPEFQHVSFGAATTYRRAELDDRTRLALYTHDEQADVKLDLDHLFR